MQKKVNVWKNKRELLNDCIGGNEVVLDIGFWGQATKREHADWPHGIILKKAKEVWGVDLDFDETALAHADRYTCASAEVFDIENAPKMGFSIITALDVIEHLSNPGLFLRQVEKHLSDDGILLLTTPNAFNLFSILEKMVKTEPSVNKDHTMYFNQATLTQLLNKNGFSVSAIGYVDTFPKVSSAKRFLAHLLRRFIGLYTPKYAETLVVVARKESHAV